MSDLASERLAELRRLAEAATPGLWEVVGLDGYGGPYALRMPHRSGRTWYGVEGIKRLEDAEYFVAMNRNTVLALLDEIERLREAAPAVQGEPVAYIRQEDFEFILADDKSEPYGTRRAPVFSRNDCRDPVPLYASPQPPAQDVEALLRQVLEVLSSAHQTAMEQSLKARIPECGEFAGIAQDLDFVVAALRERLGEGAEP